MKTTDNEYLLTNIAYSLANDSFAPMYRIIYVFLILSLFWACGQNQSGNGLMTDLVTIKAFNDYVSKNGIKTSADSIGWVGTYDKKYKRWRRILGANHLKPNAKENALETDAVTNINWYEANSYCLSKSMRLPTLEELRESNQKTNLLYGEWTSTPHEGRENTIHFESAMLINGISLPGYYIYTHSNKVAEVVINNHSIPAEPRYGMSKISCRCIK